MVFSMTTGFADAKTKKAEELRIEADSAIIYVGGTGEVLYEMNADKKMEPASMTKLLTCLIAAEQLDLNKKVVINAEAAAIPPVEIGLVEGEEITVRDLIYASLLESANDAATALAIETSGSVSKFAKLMNDRANAIGCKNTKFVNSSGHSAEGQYSTSRDIALIAEAALSNETIREVSGTPEYTIPATNKSGARTVKSFNLFLKGKDVQIGDIKLSVKKYDGVFGGKTGSLGNDYCTMVTGLDYDGIELYSVIMGSTMKARFDDMKKVMDYGKTNISKYSAFEKGEDLGEAKLTHGATNRVIAEAAKEGFVNLPEGASASLVTTKCIYSDNLEAPIKKGQKIGVAEIYMADELYNKVDLVAAENIKTGWFLSPFGITNVQTIFIGVVIGLILCFIITVLVLRAKNKRKLKMLRQRRLEEEARKQREREEDLRRRNWYF